MKIPSHFRGQASRIILEQFDRMMAQEAGTLLGEDIECLHRMRVASRRLRARIRDFKPLFGGRRYARIEKQVRRITRRLGSARDLDVFEAFLVGLSRRPARARVPKALLQAAREAQTAARRELLVFFHELRLRAAADRIRGYFGRYAQEPIDQQVLRTHMRSFARQVIQPRLRALEAYRHKRFTGADGPGELHRMRIGAKKLRYSMEIFEIYYGRDFAALIGEVRAIQDYAGHVHDLEVYAQRIQEFVRQGRLDARAGARVAARCGQLRDEAFGEFQQGWQAFWKLNLGVRLHRYWAGAAAHIPG
jgi:CHAD domain-containing protein